MIADAFLIIDMQNGVCISDNYEIENLNECIHKINNRIKQYRLKGKPIIFIQHNDESLVNGEFSWQIISELDCQKEDLYIQKTHANSFYKTELQHALSSFSVINIEICGAQTEYCVDSTIKVAHGLGYNLQMYSGLSTTYDNDYMKAQQTINFYESIWNKRFLNLLT